MHRYKKLQYYSVETVYFSPLFIVAQCFCINVFERCVIKRCRWTIDLWNLIQTQERPVIIQIEVLRGVKDLAFCLGVQFFMNMWPEEVKCTWMTVKIAAKLEGKMGWVHGMRMLEFGCRQVVHNGNPHERCYTEDTNTILKLLSMMFYNLYIRRPCSHPSACLKV